MLTCNSKSDPDSNILTQIGHCNTLNVLLMWLWELADELFTDGLSGSKCDRLICSSNTAGFSEA